MPSPARYYPSYDKPPLCFAVTGARALPGPVLVDLMVRLDLTESANRTVLNRMTTSGSLELERVGRVGVYRLAGRLLEDFERIGRGGTPPPWDGSFHVLVDTLPVTGHADAARFRAAAQRVGYRPLREGVLLAPRDASAVLASQIESLGVVAGRLDVVREDARRIARVAWDLDRLTREGVAIVQRLEAACDGGLDHVDGEESFRLLHQLMRPVVEWTVRAGDLPEELAPDDWPGARIGELAGAVHVALQPGAGRFAKAIVREGPHAHLAEWFHH